MWTTDEDKEGRRQAVQETNDLVNRANTRTRRNIGVENIITGATDSIRQDGEVTEKTLNKLAKAMEILKKKGATAFDDILKDMPQVGDSAEIVEDKLRQIEKAAKDAVDELATADYADAGVLRAPEGEVDAIQELTDAYREEIRVVGEKNEAVSAEQKAMEDLNNRVNNATGTQKTWADTLVGTAQGISSVTMGITSLVAGF
jgi:DNA repair ATPase RecN